MLRKDQSAKRRIKSANGREWVADICMHAGSDGQAPRLVVIFRDPVRVQPDRYTLLPPGSPKQPKEAAKQVSEEELRALLLRSTAL